MIVIDWTLPPMTNRHDSPEPGTTCWTLIQGAAEGNGESRAAFARLYLPVIRAYLAARWRRSPLSEEVEDATQEALLDCLREDGALNRVQPAGGPGGFRAFLLAVTQNIARRFESRRARRREQQPGSAFRISEIEADGASVASAFDQAWCLSLVDQALALQEERARDNAGAARRLELLHLRFRDDLSIREIAGRWNVPAEQVHYDYRKARRDFTAALRDVVAFHYPTDPQARKREIDRLETLVE